MYNDRKYTVPSRFLKEAGLVATSRQPSAELSRARAREYMRDGSGGAYEPSPVRGTSAVYRSGQKPSEQKKDLGAYSVGTVVEHKKFGRGTITKLENEAGGVYAEIQFEKFGKMLLSLQYAPLTIVG